MSYGICLSLSDFISMIISWSRALDIFVFLKILSFVLDCIPMYLETAGSFRSCFYNVLDGTKTVLDVEVIAHYDWGRALCTVPVNQKIFSSCGNWYSSWLGSSWDVLSSIQFTWTCYPLRLLCPWDFKASRLPFLSPGDLPNPGIGPVSCIADGFFTVWVTREAVLFLHILNMC